MTILAKISGGLLSLTLLGNLTAFASEPLSLWANAKIKHKITGFVKRVTTANDPVYLPAENRTAVFTQLSCAADANSWAAMKELMAYLRQAGFTINVISGDGTDSVKIVSEQEDKDTKNFPKHSNDTEQLPSQDPAALTRLNSGKGVSSTAIEKVLAKQPVLTVGARNADLPLLQYTASNTPALVIVLNHGHSSSYKADKLLEYGLKNGWLVINTQKDFRQINNIACKTNVYKLKSPH